MSVPEYTLNSSELETFGKEQKKLERIVSKLSKLSTDKTLKVLESLKQDITGTKESCDVLFSLIPWFVKNIGQGSVERFAAIYISNNKQILHRQVFSEGSISKCNIFPRQIVEIAFKYNATNVVICHNHPSGTFHPSENDRNLTVKMKDILAPLEITLLEHFIVTRDCDKYFSFRNQTSMLGV
jgi:DNA repair protein RadC